MRPYLSIIGFVLFALGVLSVVMSMVGLKLTILDPIYKMGIWTVVLQVILIFGGMIMLYVSRIDVDEE
ncbi:MAG: hypothetical protein KDC04_02785 [Saprospiraceae bacterium]|nr:hypothetical protein [Saprospiraceae bacterium]